MAVMALPVITVEQMRRWEAATWESGKTEEEVIAQVDLVEHSRAGDIENFKRESDIPGAVIGCGEDITTGQEQS